MKPKQLINLIAQLRQFQGHMVTFAYYLERMGTALDEFKRAYKRAENSVRQ